MTLHTPSPVQKGPPPCLYCSLNCWEETELTFRAFPGGAGTIQRNSSLTCTVGGGLEYRLQGPVNFLEGAVAGMGLQLWENHAGGVQERC